LASVRIFEPVESESVIRVDSNPQTLQTLHSPSKLAYVYIDSLLSVLVKLLRLWHLQAVRFGEGDDAHTRRQEARSRQRRCTATAPLSTADDARGDDTYKDDDVEEAAPIEEAQDTLQKVNATADDARGDDSYEDDDKYVPVRS